MMKPELGRCAVQLRKAVRFQALNSGTPKEKLAPMYNDTGFGSIYMDDFPSGVLKEEFLTIREMLTDSGQRQATENHRSNVR
jgi:hypothetical protein